MKAKHLSLAIAALLAAGGLWLARPGWRTHASHKSSMGVAKMSRTANPNSAASLPKASQTAPGPDNAPARLAPPDPLRRFTDFTPEQRVDFARQGHGPGG